MAEKLNTTDTPFYAIEVFKDKLIITGFSIPSGGKSYKMASFDGSNFTPISDQYFGFNMLVAHDKLFFSLGSVMQYDDTGFQPINIGGNSNIATDDEGSLYIASNTISAQNKYVCSIQKYGNAKTTTLGENLNCFIQYIQFYNGTIVIYGDVEQKAGVSYYFKNNKWIKIETSYMLSDMIVYNNELIGSPSISGQPLTLELK